MEADGPSDTKTRERTEGAANKAVQAMHGDKFSANRVENGAAAPKSCLSPTAAVCLLPAGMASTATRTYFHQLPLWFSLTEETNSRTSVLYVSYLTIFGWINNQQAPSCPRVVEKII